MKRFFLSGLFALLSMTPLWAFTTTITSVLYVDTAETMSANPTIGDLPTGARRVRFINHATGIPQLETALEEASNIFTAAMANASIDLVEMEVEVVIDSTITEDEVLCKADIFYTDTINDNSSYHQIGLYLGYPHPVLIPMAMSNQSRRNNYGPCMRIRLRNDLPYYCGTGQAEEGQYDAITIILRALAMGCGVQSTIDPNTMNLGIQNGGVTYVNAFDTQIFNEDMLSLVNVVDGMISLNSFINGKKVYAVGQPLSYDLDTVHVELFNMWKYCTPDQPLTSLSLNSIDHLQYRDNWGYGSEDILSVFIKDGVSLREVTPYTKALLYRLGWMRTIPVGNDPLNDLTTCQITCNSTVFQPSTTYAFSLSKDNVYLQNLRGELISKDSVYTIGTGSGILQTFRYENMPTNNPGNIQWRRNPSTKNIIGQIKADAFVSGNSSYIQTKIFDFEIPYRPNRPIVQKSETSNSSYINLDLSVFANGSDTYTITYTGLSNSDTHTITINADAIDTVLNIPATQYYDVAIYGTNYMGNSDTYYFTIGGSIQPTINLKLTTLGGALRYYLNSQNATSLPNVVVGTCMITNPNNTITLYPNAGPGEAINISSLPNGIYLFSVVLNGETYSKIFFKL